MITLKEAMNLNKEELKELKKDIQKKKQMKIKNSADM